MSHKRDPHMKNPMPKYILIAVIIALILIFIVPEVTKIINANLNDVENRANED